MATTTPNFGWPVPTSSDLVKNGATAIEALGDGIDASLLDLKGGTSGQVLKKNSNTDMDFVWGADSAGMTNPMTTTGDTIYSSSGSTPARLGIGTTGQVLTVASGVPSWATPAAGGSGLTLVKAQTIGSAVSSVEVTSAFSATYDNYLITITGGAGSADSLDVSIQFGATTTGYAYSGTYQSTTSATLNTYATDSTTVIGISTLSTLGAAAEAFITSPFLSSRTGVAARGTPLVSGDFRTDYAGRLSNTTSYTSFKLGFSGGTMTGGTVRVYGYQNS
jgi:hypothetical protein